MLLRRCRYLARKNISGRPTAQAAVVDMRIIARRKSSVGDPNDLEKHRHSIEDEAWTLRFVFNRNDPLRPLHDYVVSIHQAAKCSAMQIHGARGFGNVAAGPLQERNDLLFLSLAFRLWAR